jgi:glycosyltransferase involved in cell wall biosynthesis
MNIFCERPVFLDVTRLVYRMRKGRIPTGVDRVCLAYAAHFHGRAQAVMIQNGVAAGLSAAASMVLFDWLLDWESGQPRASLRETMRQLLKWRLRSMPDGSWVLNMGHSGLDRQSYLGWLKRKKMRLLVMAHDLIPITHPQFCQPDATGAHLRRLQVILGQASGIVSNSQHTAEALENYARQAGVTVPPLAVIPPGVKKYRGAEHADRDPPKTPYFVVLGTLEPRKNHKFLLCLWQRMRNAWPQAQIPQLRIIGQIGWMCDGVIHELTHNVALKPYVTLRTDCGDAELRYYLQHARALLFPSHTEGYGLPLTEALELGVPVLASPLPVFREVAKDVPDYIDLNDEDAWLAALRAYATADHPRRAAQLRRLQGFLAPTWVEHFARFEDFLGSL